MTSEFQPHDLFVSTQGNDRWSGRLPEPNADKTDGPFATLVSGTRRGAGDEAGRRPARPAHGVGARRALPDRMRRSSSAPDDSAPVTYAAYPGEQPVIDGGRRITGWQIAALPRG